MVLSPSPDLKKPTSYNPVSSGADVASTEDKFDWYSNSYMNGMDNYGEGMSTTPGSSLDASGYDQAMWEFQKQQELLAEQRYYNSAEAEKLRQWQERMSNTAYQRATRDLEAAGLNKWLAVTGGNGASASTPSGASASSSAGDASQPNPTIYKTLMEFYGKIITSALKIIDVL